MKKDLLALLFVVLLIAVLISGTDIQSVEDYYLTHADDVTEDSETVTVSITCKTVLDHMQQLDENVIDEIPADGVILKPTVYVLREGDTAFDLLKRVTQHEQIQMEYQGARDNAYQTAYIEGIGYLYEFSCGPLSGWMYTVNGDFLQTGCSRYALKDGDVLEFVYTCDLGRDVGAAFGGSVNGDADQGSAAEQGFDD